MKDSVKKKIIKKMYDSGLINEQEYNDENVSEQMIEMYVKGIEIIGKNKSIIGQIEEYKKYLKYVDDTDGYTEEQEKENKRFYEKGLKKLKELKERFEKEGKSLSVAKSQLEDVRDHLYEHGSITTYEALSNYEVTRLSAIIYTLRHREGMEIVTITESKKSKYGNRVNYSVYKYGEAKEEE